MMLTTKMILPTIFTIIISYLLGSINFALIVSRLVAKDDIRNHGSGNAGATNMLRTYGKLPALATAAGDFLKAILAVALSRMIFLNADITIIDAGYLAGLFVFLGHLYPVFFHFKGGKGAIVTLAVILAVNPIVFIIVIVIFLPFIFIVRIVSLASVLGAISYPIITFIVDVFILGKSPVFDTIFAAIIAVFILISHRENIKRILNGTESKLGKTK